MDGIKYSTEEQAVCLHGFRISDGLQKLADKFSQLIFNPVNPVHTVQFLRSDWMPRDPGSANRGRGFLAFGDCGRVGAAFHAFLVIGLGGVEQVGILQQADRGSGQRLGRDDRPLLANR